METYHAATSYTGQHVGFHVTPVTRGRQHIVLRVRRTVISPPQFQYATEFAAATFIRLPTLTKTRVQMILTTAVHVTLSVGKAMLPQSEPERTVLVVDPGSKIDGRVKVMPTLCLTTAHLYRPRRWTYITCGQYRRPRITLVKLTLNRSKDYHRGQRLTLEHI